MARIELSMGLFSLIDDADLPLVGKRSWYTSNNGYAVSGERDGGKYRMHGLLFGNPVGMDVDHVNGDRLDNRRHNLRACSRAENIDNARHKWPVVSRFAGVFRRFIWDKWFVLVSIPGGQVYCGDYSEEEAAARAHDSAVRHYCGFLDAVNFPGGDIVPMDQRSLLIANGQCRPPASKYRGVASGGSSKGKGTWKKWAAQIYAGRNYKLGYFDVPGDAAQVYDAACLILGKLNRMNFPGSRPADWAMEKAAAAIGPVSSAA